MSVILNNTPVLTQKLKNKIGFHPNGMFEFGYSYSNGNTVPLIARESDSSSRCKTFKLTDDNCKWHPENNSLDIRHTITIDSPINLFGTEGLASKSGGRIGIAVIWADKELGERGVFNSEDNFSASSGRFECILKSSFPPKALRGTLSLQYVLYLKEKGQQSIEEQQCNLATECGTVFGVLEEVKIIIDGNGSIFPIQEVSVIKDALWWVKTDWQDPTSDPFVLDNFKLVFNKAHKDYQYLVDNETNNNHGLLSEVMASVIQLLISKVVKDTENRDKIFKGSVARGDYEPDSIAAVVRYYVDTIGIHSSQLEDEEEIARLTRKWVASVL